MTITTQDLFEILSKLRSPNTVEIQLASNKLQELVQDPNTILHLFTLLENAQDQTLRHYAYFALANCFRTNKGKINPDFFLRCRQQVINLLNQEVNIQCIEALITVTQILIDPNVPWPEIIHFVFSINYNESFKNLFLALSIFNGIITCISPELLIQNQENIMNLALTGLNFDPSNQQIICQAVLFLYTIFLAFQTKTSQQISYSPVFQERLLTIFQHSIMSADINYFMHIISPIINGYTNNIFIFPVTNAMPLILQVLQNEQFDLIFRLLVHYFFIISLTYPNYSSILTKENWNLLIQIEKYITNLIISASLYEIDHIKYFEDVFEGISIFLKQMPPTEAVSFVLTQGQSLLQNVNMTNPSSLLNICFALLLFCNCVNTYLDNMSYQQLDIIYQSFLAALNSHNHVLMSIVGYYLIDLFKNFAKLVNDKYIPQTLNSIIIYLKEETKEDYLLYSFVKILDNTDPIFSNLLELCFQLINSGSPLAQYCAYNVIGESIDRSELVAYGYFNPLYKHFSSIIKTPQIFVQFPHSIVLTCMISLINLAPEQIEPLIDDFLPPIMQAFHATKDQNFIQDILNVLDCISNNKDLVKSLNEQYYEVMVADFPPLIRKDWKTKIEKSIDIDTKYQKVLEKFINASHALEILTKFTVEYKQLFIENLIMNFLPSFFQVLKMIYETLEDVSSVFNTLILIIGNQDFFIRGEKYNREVIDLQQMSETIKISPNEELLATFEGTKNRLEMYHQEIQICKIIFPFVMELFQVANEESFASDLFSIIKLLIANKCIPTNQFEGIINTALTVITRLNNSSLCTVQFAHLICEIAKKSNFDIVCKIIIPFVNQLLSKQEDIKLIIDAINFIKSLDDFSFIFLQKPEMGTFWSQIPKLIADPNNNKEIASAIVKMMATVCQKPKREQIIPIAMPLLEATKKRLIAELNQPSGLRDNLAAFLAILGGAVIGDNFPFNEIIPLILNAIPLQYDFTLCTDIYQFITGICHVIIFTNEEMKRLYAHRLIELLSQPFKKIKMMNIYAIVLKSLLSSLTEALNENDNENKFKETVLQILGGDETKFAMFVQTFNKIRLINININEWGY